MNRDLATAGRMRTSALLALGAAAIVACIVYAPQQAFEASLEGLKIWWHIVFPALLPFLVLTEMLIALGIIHGIGTLLTPLMRSLFRLPGSAGFVLPLGAVVGFPSGAAAAAKLHQRGQLPSSEAARLAALSHFCNPMLIIIVISAGFLHQPAVGSLLLIVHLLAGLGAGFIYSRMGRGARNKAAEAEVPEQPHAVAANRSQVSLFKQAYRSMEQARRLDGRSFGKLLGDAVSEAVQTLMTVGGFMLIFAVVIQILSRAFPSGFPAYILPGLLEVHLGTYAIVQQGITSPALQAALLSAVLGWGGLCSYFQVRAVLKPAGLQIRGFLFTRLLHGAIAYVLTLLIWKQFNSWFPQLTAVSTDSGAEGSLSPVFLFPNGSQSMELLVWQSGLLAVVIAGLVLFSLIWKHRRSEH
ncbi:nucleoside recognition domain-containing protein [Paenibacillus sp. CAA11]|uniref:nucleoside recognition domain-containing protein n=1 Tax=Paenibacillus sp. CAA11 TaxID=1532905 RepID=UPI000D3A58B5|nr:nucleoside recognition domain-containing protein [Paenibacillus sp. CAA11]AWB44247.1 nucleoside recognition domain-containing protein [Paenibacillus sp. CAA11]